MKITTENNKVFINGNEIHCTSYEIRWNPTMEGGAWNYEIHTNAEAMKDLINLIKPAYLNGDLNRDDGKGIVWFSYYCSEIAWLSVNVITSDWEEKKQLAVIAEDFAGRNWVKS